MVVDTQNIYSLFKELFELMKKEKKVLETPWIDISKVKFFKSMNDQEIEEIIYHISFLKKEKFNCISIDKIEFILESMGILRYDIKDFSAILHHRGFELLIKKILSRNGYYVKNNYYFSDKTSLKNRFGQTRYEIDIIGLHNHYLLLIDGKQWNKRSPIGTLNKAANLQFQRAIALKNNPTILAQLLAELIRAKNRKQQIESLFPLRLIPLMVTLEENPIKVNRQNTPLVSIYRLNAFLNELMINIKRFRHLIIEKLIF